jgi:hypothetical protein
MNGATILPLEKTANAPSITIISKPGISQNFLRARRNPKNSFRKSIGKRLLMRRTRAKPSHPIGSSFSTQPLSLFAIKCIAAGEQFDLRKGSKSTLEPSQISIA